ncbi:hypothetical protein [Singulisphaera acidiphila]|uniref:Lipoprotein n=1 Tax=Singulisphaera acidiphila (strain ATCC BAA-1392 / DSM 18658 / VKM B-2454 / MOB10) TaxID=886293 RepID=L0DIJ1_SINAD|nr:hypothetical protein [Singulisphaera acidiphila]AGA28675.1 hypothetical protein Sinac_4487 [Singulisphaera acidiphila DSM 18658]
MSFTRMTSVGLVLAVFFALPGCGEGGGGTAPTIDETRPDAGLEASKKLQQMQPPPRPGGAGKNARH